MSNRWHLDEHGNMPLHAQLAQRIQDAIESGELESGQQIPTERELMREANVSRSTVRHAINQLVQQDLLERVQGKGTFVKQFKVETSLQVVYSFAAQFAIQGLRLKDKVLECEVTAASPLIAHKLNMQPGEDLISLQRLRFVEKKPIMVNISFIPKVLCPGLVLETFAESSLYQLFTNKYDIPVVSATDTLEAIPADETIAHHLQVPLNTSLMYVKRMAFTRNHVPVHMGLNYIRGDMCRFRSDMHSQPASIELKNMALGD